MHLIRQIAIATIGAVLALLILAAFIWATSTAHAHDWAEPGTTEGRWFESLMQPDNPAVSCCGLADSYWADSYEAEGDHYVAIITDTRDDLLPDGRTRPHIAPGTRIPVPNAKIKFDAGNPTGHGVIFMPFPISGGSTVPYCYVAPGGV